MYFFNLQTLFQALLSTKLVVNKIYIRLGHFVDAPNELQEANVQQLSIRILSSQFVYYATGLLRLLGLDSSTAPRANIRLAVAAIYTRQFRGYKGEPIFQSNFVRFQYTDSSCQCYKVIIENAHFGRIATVVYNHFLKPVVKSREILVKINSLVNYKQLYTIADVLASLKPALILYKELVLVKNYFYYIPVLYVTALDSDIYINYVFRSSYAPLDTLANFKYILRRIVSRALPPPLAPPGLAIAPISYGAVSSTRDSSYDRIRFHPIQQIYPIRGELEILYFGCQALIDNFSSSTPVLTILLVIFLDAFGLFCNIYRSLLGFYFLNSAFTSKERNRRINLILFTIGLYSSNSSDIIAAIALLLVPLNTSIKIVLNRVETVVYTILFFFISDMLQQAANSRFITQRATYSYRSCIFLQKDQKSLELDIVGKGRYYYEIERIR